MRLIDADKFILALMDAALSSVDEDTILDLVDSVPTVDAVPVVHERFVHDGQRFAGGVDWWHCSNCGRLASGVETRFDYCPWCGARMDGDSDAAD
jgi:rubrerythrin